MFPKHLQSILDEIIGKTFNSLRFNLLGPDKVSKAFVFSYKGSKYDPKSTIAGAYMEANLQHSHDPRSIDKKTIQMLTDVAEEYINNLEQKSTADVGRIVSQYLSDINLKAKLQGLPDRHILLTDEGQDILKAMRKDLKEQKDKIDKSASLISDYERHKAYNYGAMDGILTSAKAIGISDPTVIKIGVVDEKLSDMCEFLWHTSGNIHKPKAYKLSELKGGEGNPKKGMWEPTLGLSHINCRHVLTPILPGFGLDDSGKIVYKGLDADGNPWDEYKHQRNQR